MSLSGRLNSVYTHMLALAFCIVGALTVYTLYLLGLDEQRRTPRLSMYELSRVVTGQPLARRQPDIQIATGEGDPPPFSGGAETFMSRQLAQRLGRPAGDVRVYLDADDRRKWARRLEVYGPESASDPVIDGAFKVALKQGNNSWRIYERTVPPRFGTLGLGVLHMLLIGMFAALSLWFGSRMANPIKRFATAATRMRIGTSVETIPLTGPTELRQAAEAVNDMNVRIARFVRERASITAAVAHDLRSPLSRIKFHVAAAPLPIREAVESEIDDMEKMVALTLDFVESDTRSLKFETIELQTFVEGIVDNFRDLGKAVDVVEAESIRIDGDPLSLKRLFNNLIDNALRYGGTARVAVRKAANGAIVDFIDDGPGMTAKILERAFEPFFRGETSRNRETGGVGLGLSIAKTAAVAHGGDLQLENMPLGGLRARVILPFRMDAEPEISTQRRKRCRNRSRNGPQAAATPGSI